MVTRNDLTQEEWDWVLRLSKHNGALITTKMADRLKKLGVAEQKLGGTGLSREGKALVDAHNMTIISARKARGW